MALETRALQAAPEAAMTMTDTVDDGDVRWDPQDEEFIEDVVLWGVASWTVGVAVLIAFLIYFIVRCICWICLHDECCDKRNKVRASPKFVKANNIAISLLLIISIAAAGWLLYAGTPIIDSLDHLTSTMIEQAHAATSATIEPLLKHVAAEQVEPFLATAADVVTSVRNALATEADVDLSELNSAEQQLTDARDKLLDIKSDVDESTDGFHGVIITVAVGAIICAVLGLLCVFVRAIIFLYLYFIVGFFVIFFLWCLAGFGITGNRAFVETCDMMKLHVAGDRNPTVLEELHCDELTGVKSQINEAVFSLNDAVEELNADLATANARISVINRAHEDIEPVCLPFVLEDGEYVAVDVTADAFANATATTTAPACVPLQNDTITAAYGPRVCQAELPANPNPLTNQTYLACVRGDPSRPLTRQQFTDAQGRSVGVEVLVELLPHLYDIVNCAFVDSAFKVIIAEECDSLDEDSYGLAAAAFTAAISLTLTTFYFCICIQNIRKQDAPQPSPEEKMQFVTN